MNHLNLLSTGSWKNTHYAEYVRRSSVIVSRILAGIRHNTAYNELGMSGQSNPWHSRESWRTSLVKLEQKVNKMAQQGWKGQQN